MDSPLSNVEVEALWQAALDGVTLDAGKPASSFSSVSIADDDVPLVFENLFWAIRRSSDTAIPYLATQEELEASLPRELALLERGVRLRTIVPADSLHSLRSRSHARRVSDAGGEMRAGVDLGLHRVVFDGAIALYSESGQNDDYDGRAVLCRRPGTVQSMIALFEAAWKSAVDLAAPSGPRDRLDDIDREMLRLIVNGAKNKEMSEAVGLSLSQIERRQQNLRQVFGVTSKAALAAAAARWARGGK